LGRMEREVWIFGARRSLVLLADSFLNKTAYPRAGLFPKKHRNQGAVLLTKTQRLSEAEVCLRKMRELRTYIKPVKYPFIRTRNPFLRWYEVE
jgi:hypothetical protein